MNYKMILPVLTTALVLSGCGATTVNKAAVAPIAATPAPVNTFIPGSVTLAEVAKHNSASDCWMAIDGQVYDVTAQITGHPGGDKILNGCGLDATQMFHAVEKHTQVKGVLKGALQK